MATKLSSQTRSSNRDRGTQLKTFLTAVMSLLSVLVLALGGWQRNVFWLWIGFVSALISGVFIQLFINGIKNDVAAGRR